MADNTDNHELNKYSQGEDNWTHSTDMDTIEERLVVRDVESNRTGYTPHSDAIFIATDTGAIYDGDGSSWNKGDRGFDGAIVDGELKLPTYADNANAVQEERSLWYNDGTGPDQSGYYRYDGGSITGPAPRLQLDGNGNIVPRDGETIGDGTTSANHKSVTADHTQGTSTSSVTAPPSDTDLLSRKSAFTWERVTWEHKSSAIIDGTSNSYEQAGWPCILHGPSVFDSPLDTWYLYWGTHDGMKVYLSTASSLWSDSWTLQTTVLDANNFSNPPGHISSPDVIHDPLNDRVLLYYHAWRENDQGQQETEYATVGTTGDGTSFSRQDIAIPAPMDNSWYEKHTGYLRAIRYGGEFIGVVAAATDNINQDKRIGVVRSHDGENWSFERHAVADGYIDPAEFNGGSVDYGQPDIVEFAGEPWIFYEAKSASETQVRAVRFSRRHESPLNGKQVIGAAPWGNQNSLWQGNLVQYDGTLYYFYTASDDSTAGSSIGVARVNMGDIL